MPPVATTAAAPPGGQALLRLALYSLIGLAVFFVPIEIAGRTTIPLDHAATAVATYARPVALAFVCLLILYGALAPLWDGSWRKDRTTLVFTALKLLGVVTTAAYLTGIGPAALFAPDMLPFLFDKLVMTVGLIVPIGAIALGFLIGFGLLELVGVLVDRIMRPVWRTPGWSAIDAVASFVGSYSLALLITDRVYRDGKYSVREAAIIATGFSTVSATFMIVVAKTLGLMEVWNLYFWSTLVVTFAVTAITARLRPIARLRHEERPEVGLPEGRSRLQAALDAGLAQSTAAPPLHGGGPAGPARRQVHAAVRPPGPAARAVHVAGAAAGADARRQGHGRRPRRDVPAGHPAQGGGCRYQIRRGDCLGEPDPVPVGLGTVHPGDDDPAAAARPPGRLAAAHGAQHPARGADRLARRRRRLARLRPGTGHGARAVAGIGRPSRRA
jgi:hypothetical protein